MTKDTNKEDNQEQNDNDNPPNNIADNNESSDQVTTLDNQEISPDRPKISQWLVDIEHLHSDPKGQKSAKWLLAALISFGTIICAVVYFLRPQYIEVNSEGGVSFTLGNTKNVIFSSRLRCSAYKVSSC